MTHEALAAITAMHRAIDGMEKMADINPVDEALAYLAFRICGLRNRALHQRLYREATERLDTMLEAVGQQPPTQTKVEGTFKCV